MKTVLTRYMVMAFAVITIFFTTAESYAKNSIGKSKGDTSVQNSFTSPDFAYPKTVITNAETQLRKASTEKDLIMATIQMVIAQNQISDSNFLRTARLIDSIAEKTSPITSAILLTLEAQLYREKYTSSRWKFDNRQLSPDSIITNIEEWDSNRFACKVRELSNKSLSNKDILFNTPLSDVKGVLADYTRDMGIFYPTIYHLIGTQALKNLKPFYRATAQSTAIPFYQSKVEISPAGECKILSTQIAEALYKYALERNNGAAMASVLSLEHRYNIFDYNNLLQTLHQEFERFSNSQYSTEILNLWFQLCYSSSDLDNVMKQMFYSVMKKQLQSFPEYNRIDIISADLDLITQPKCIISGSGQYTSDTPVSVTVENTNLNNQTYLSIFSVNRDDGEKYRYNTQKLFSLPGKIKHIKSLPIPVNKELFTTDTCSIDFGVLPVGLYLITATKSSTGTTSSVIDPGNVSCVTVSNLLSFSSSSDTEVSTHTSIYAVNSSNSKPESDVKIKLKTVVGKKEVNESMTTDSDGKIEVPNSFRGKSLKYTIQKGSDIVSSYTYVPTVDKKIRPQVVAKIFTDLAIYHPGDTVRLAIVTYSTDNLKAHITDSERLKIIVKNASWQSIDTLLLTTDIDGRTTGFFRLPTSGMLGDYSIIAERYQNSNNSQIGITNFKVAEYKQPGFYVENASSSQHYNIGDTISISGYAKTYSNIPISNAKCEITIRFSKYGYHTFRNVENEYSATLTTDSEGKFLLQLPTDNLNGTAYANGLYSVRTSVTSETGESQTSPSINFVMGSTQNHISLDNIPSKILLSSDKNLDLKITATNVNQSPVSTELEYTLEDTISRVIISEGRFTSPLLSIDSAIIPSGEYELKVRPIDNDSTINSKTFIVFRDEDKCPPIKTSLWIPQNEYIALPNDKTINVAIGSSYKDSYILYQSIDSDGKVENRWLHVDAQNIYVPVTAPTGDGITKVTFTTVRNCKTYQSNVTITTYDRNRSLTVETISFRDSITAGGREHWTFRYNLGNNVCGRIPVIATMSDKALNALTPFKWSFSQPWKYTPSLRYDIPYLNDFSSFVTFSTRSDYKSYKLLWQLAPNIHTYGRQLYGGMKDYDMTLGSRAGVKVRGTANGVVYVDNVVNEVKMAMKSEATIDDVATGVSTDVIEENKNNVKLRDTEHPLAFFKPNLKTSEDGTMELSFDVPDFSTTWQLQLLGYTPDIKTCVDIFDIIASKPIMVQTNAPRFLRTGDKATLLSNVFNNSDQTQEICTIVELFDPISGKTINDAYHNENISLSAQKSQILQITIDVPDTLEFIGYRVTATTNKYTDGEQVLIAVLPSSTPIFESSCFYSGLNQSEITIPLPTNKEKSMITLSYCDNPIWFCVTALPELVTSDSQSIISKITSLFGRNTAYGLTAQFPEIKKAIEAWNSDYGAALTSSLQKDDELKIVSLQNTPWISNAEGETLRMNNLSLLLDTDVLQNRIDDDYNKIITLQQADGGWSWCEGMKSSVFITQRILHTLALLKDMNYLPDNKNLENAINRGMAYVDKSLYSEYIKHKKQFSDVEMLDWLFTRSSLTSSAGDTGFALMAQTAVKSIKKNWRNFDTYHTATAALLLYRKGFQMEARAILESLRQNAMTSEKRGMWFDNLKSGWNGMSKLLTTSQVLRAYHEVQPQDSAIDKIRQWLLTERQVQDWGESSELSEIIYTILTTGSNWTKYIEPAVISINNTELSIPNREEYIGSFTIPINIDNYPAESQIKILKEGTHPAWGGIAIQYVAPITEIHSYSDTDIAISKHIFKIDTAENASILREVTEDNLQIGDRIKIQIVVSNTRDMEYVVITDERAGCLSPNIQLSGNNYQDGIGFYREVANTQTNYYIPFLPKGNFILSYDCHVSQAGIFASGIATVQSLYSPMLSAHSSGGTITTQEQSVN